MSDIVDKAKELLRLEKKATPGVWSSSVHAVLYSLSEDSELGTIESSHDDADFIIYARNNAPEIAKALIESQAQIKEWRKALESISKETLEGGERSTDGALMAAFNLNRYPEDKT